MVIKVYVALISCSQEVKKNQQRAIMILESKKVPYSIIDITDPSNEDAKEYMVENAKPKEGAKIPVTPQIFNEADYCGDFDGLDMANECDTLGDFLKLTEEEKAAVRIGITGIIPNDETKAQDDSKMTNGVSASREVSPEKPLENEQVLEEKEEIRPTEETIVESSINDEEKASINAEEAPIAVETTPPNPAEPQKEEESSDESEESSEEG